MFPSLFAAEDQQGGTCCDEGQLLPKELHCYERYSGDICTPALRHLRDRYMAAWDDVTNSLDLLAVDVQLVRARPT